MQKQNIWPKKEAIVVISRGGEIAGQPINGSVFVYLGKQPGKFITVFQRFGKVLFSPPEDAL